MAGFVIPIRMGQLTINPSGASPGTLETNLRAACYLVEDMSPLWEFPAHYGSNLRVPGADGKLPLERFTDETTISLALTIGGDAAYDASANANVFTGLRANVDRLLANVHGEPVGSATRAAKLTLPSGSALTAAVQCSLALGGMFGPHLRAVLDVTIPAGRFA